MAAIVHELFRFGFYKRNQGRIARRATLMAFAIIVALGALRFSQYLGGVLSEYPDLSVVQQNLIKYCIPLALLAVGLWASFRIVQMPTFADFLISVEGEMNKVSWPSRSQLFRASVVVLLVIFFLAGILYLYDLVLTWFLTLLDLK